VELNRELDGGRLCLLLDPLLHITRCLPDLEETDMLAVVNGVGVDTRPNLGLWGQNLVDRLAYPRPRCRLLRQNLLEDRLTHRPRRLEEPRPTGCRRVQRPEIRGTRSRTLSTHIARKVSHLSIPRRAAGRERRSTHRELRVE